MSYDAVLNLLGFIISLAGLIIAKPNRRVLTLSLFGAVAATALVALFVDIQRSAELDRVEERIKQKLKNNRWTAERITAEIRTEDKKIIRDALNRAADAGSIGDGSTECISNDGTVLTTRVFYNATPIR